MLRGGGGGGGGGGGLEEEDDGMLNTVRLNHNILIINQIRVDCRFDVYVNQDFVDASPHVMPLTTPRIFCSPIVAPTAIRDNLSGFRTCPAKTHAESWSRYQWND
jgi:hypothetical protein